MVLFSVLLCLAWFLAAITAAAVPWTTPTRMRVRREPRPAYTSSPGHMALVKRHNRPAMVQGDRRDPPGYQNRDFDEDYYFERQRKDSWLLKLLRLLQKNYDTEKYEGKKPQSSSRVHVLENPGVLGKYQKVLRENRNAMFISTSSSSETSSDTRSETSLDTSSAVRSSSCEDYFSDHLRSRDRRRHSVDFRLGSDSIEAQNENLGEVQDHSEISSNVPDILPFEYNELLKAIDDIEASKDDDTIDNNAVIVVNNDDDVNEAAGDDGWDMITKKYTWEDEVETKVAGNLDSTRYTSINHIISDDKGNHGKITTKKVKKTNYENKDRSSKKSRYSQSGTDHHDNGKKGEEINRQAANRKMKFKDRNTDWKKKYFETLDLEENVKAKKVSINTNDEYQKHSSVIRKVKNINNEEYNDWDIGNDNTNNEDANKETAKHDKKSKTSERNINQGDWGKDLNDQDTHNNWNKKETGFKGKKYESNEGNSDRNEQRVERYKNSNNQGKNTKISNKETDYWDKTPDGWDKKSDDWDKNTNKRDKKTDVSDKESGGRDQNNNRWDKNADDSYKDTNNWDNIAKGGQEKIVKDYDDTEKIWSKETTEWQKKEDDRQRYTTTESVKDMKVGRDKWVDDDGGAPTAGWSLEKRKNNRHEIREAFRDTTKGFNSYERNESKPWSSKKKKKNLNDWDSSRPKAGHSYRQKQGGDRGPAAHAFGRTPIPFVGKKRIYDK